MHAKIDVHRRMIIAELPGKEVKCIAKLQSYCAQITSVDKSRNGRIFQWVTHKGGESAMNNIKILQYAQALSVLLGNNYSDDQSMHIFLDNFRQGGNIFLK